MPLGTNHVTATRAGTFIPEIWSDEIVAAYKQNLVAANLFKKMSFKGKKGDTVHIPAPVRGSANLKVAETQVVLNANTESEVLVYINKHYEYSRMIEDIVEVQALSSLRQFYTDDAGYALAKQVDTDLVRLGRGANGGNGTAAYDKAYKGDDGTTLYTGTAAALTSAAIRRTIQRLDDADVPMDGRFFIIPPSSRNTLLGLSEFTTFNSVGEAGSANSIRNGMIGDIYGVQVYVTTNADAATDGDRIALMAHKDFAVLAEQVSVRSQTQYKQEYLGTLFTADTLYGVAELRDTSAIALAVPA
jgi:N4-gp56 family major capsid protein